MVVGGVIPPNHSTFSSTICHWKEPAEGHAGGAVIEKLKVITSPGLTLFGRGTRLVPKKAFPEPRKYVPCVQTVVPVFRMVTDTGVVDPASTCEGTDWLTKAASFHSTATVAGAEPARQS